MRWAVRELLRLGRLPDSKANAERIAEYQHLLESISAPVTDEEAKALVTLFGPDECYGLAWTLLHLIESAPNWPLDGCLERVGNEWIDRLRRRVVNRLGQARTSEAG